MGYRDDGDAGYTAAGACYCGPQVGRFPSRDTVLSKHRIRGKREVAMYLYSGIIWLSGRFARCKMPTISQHERQKLLQQIDTLIRDLQNLRAQLSAEAVPCPGKVANLFGKLGKGSWQEYDHELDWERFVQ